ncbi:MAG: divalent-cation tolerance protein CutA [Elusimicrobia bacterium]|nr:divalent-cation tolerance protein CutA [Elusimicrobiota bacterium]
MTYLVVLVTAKDVREAKRISRLIVEKKLAACCNILSGVRSIYRWEGKVCEGREALLVIKTRRELFRPLEKEIRRVHSYRVPEIIALPLEKGSPAYLDWLSSVTRPLKRRLG